MASIGRFVVEARQKAVQEVGRAAQGSLPCAGEASGGSDGIDALQKGPGIDVPKPGSKFTDEELHDRFGVPPRGGIRVSRENKCIVIVNLAGTNTPYTNVDKGSIVKYMGQNHYGDKKGDQVMEGNNLALKRSREEGYTVLYFAKEGDVLVFDRIVEYDSDKFDYEVGKSGRKVFFFKLRTVGADMSTRRGTTGDSTRTAVKSGEEPQGGPDLGMIEAVECLVSMHRSYESRNRLLRALPERIDAQSLDRVLEYLVHSGKIAIDGEAIRWTFSLDNAHADGSSNSRGHEAALARKSILAGTRFEYIEEGKRPTETVGEYMVRVYNTDEPGTYTAEDAIELDEKMRRRAKGEYYTREQVRKELGL